MPLRGAREDRDNYISSRISHMKPSQSSGASCALPRPRAPFAHPRTMPGPVTLGDLGRRDAANDDGERDNEFYTGGAQSGMAVQDPNSGRGRGGGGAGRGEFIQVRAAARAASAARAAKAAEVAPNAPDATTAAAPSARTARAATYARLRRQRLPRVPLFARPTSSRTATALGSRRSAANAPGAGATSQRKPNGTRLVTAPPRHASRWRRVSDEPPRGAEKLAENGFD